MAQKEQGVNWDLAPYFPSFDWLEMRAFRKKLFADIASIQKKAAKLAPPSSRTAADLSVDGFQSWERLYDKISSKLTFEMRWPATGNCLKT